MQQPDMRSVATFISTAVKRVQDVTWIRIRSDTSSAWLAGSGVILVLSRRHASGPGPQYLTICMIMAAQHKERRTDMWGCRKLESVERLREKHELAASPQLPALLQQLRAKQALLEASRIASQEAASAEGTVLLPELKARRHVLTRLGCAFSPVLIHWHI